ncbi:SurA N-terminal domain-containing protein [Marinobacterium sp. AK62]|uniref:Periplasmic chaperone PpiD n=1 Tax=Marinobacterium alkalitolerans TaxID=1542925 RepID=A0ABS3ZA93_9GAMM|nr:SurA N-terminal domain-containing protein [Marinobacterium alkalitolerans]MBP0048623.1 SurA N-terminal domain-containing protein [Marinobacterium alkalitolerans]
MLQTIRENSQGIIAKVIVGLIIVTFALFGVESLIGLANSEKAPAEVNGEEISAVDLQRETELQRRQILAQMGENADPAAIDENLLRRQVLDALVSQEIRLQSAEEQGLYLSESMIDQMIVATPEFQVDGQFDPAQFESALRAVGMTPLMYRELLRKEQLIGQERMAYQLSAFSTPTQVRQLLALDRQTRDIAWVQLSLEEVEAGLEISDADVKARYDEDMERFMTEPQVVLSYIELNQNDFADAEAVDEADVRAAYEQELVRFEADEERSAAHILLEAGEGDEAELRQQAESLRERILSGELTFAEAAREYSADPGSAPQGGELGYNARGVFVGPFEDALFSMEAGELSEPVRTEFGYHLIKLKDIRATEPPSFAERENEIRAELASEQAEANYVAALEQLADLSFSSADLEVPSEELGLEIQQTEPFSRAGGNSELTSNAKILRAAFSAELQDEALNSEPLELSRERAVVVRVKEQIPSRQLAFEEVKERLEAELRRERAAAALEAKADELLTALESGQALNEVSALNWSEVANMGREAESAPLEINRYAFELPRPEGEASSFGRVSLRNGDLAIVELKAVHAADVSDLDDNLVKQMGGFIANRNGQLTYQARVEALEEAAEVERN